MSTHQSADPPATPSDVRPETTHDSTSTIDDSDALELLSDDYAQQIIRELADRPTTARVLSEEMNASRPTIYRRLNKLESSGFIESDLTVDPDGHHRKRFHLTVDSATIKLTQDGMKITANGH